MVLVIIIRFLLQTSELGVTEHIEGDECKFAVWTGRAPISDLRIILKVGVCFERCLIILHSKRNGIQLFELCYTSIFQVLFAKIFFTILY